jgi:hypothetical protein
VARALSEGLLTRVRSPVAAHRLTKIFTALTVRSHVGMDVARSSLGGHFPKEAWSIDPAAVK